jgi:hypothetical protein
MEPDGEREAATRALYNAILLLADLNEHVAAAYVDMALFAFGPHYRTPETHSLREDVPAEAEYG